MERDTLNILEQTNNTQTVTRQSQNSESQIKCEKQERQVESAEIILYRQPCHLHGA